jgi:hypothetical protein
VLPEGGSLQLNNPKALRVVKKARWNKDKKWPRVERQVTAAAKQDCSQSQLQGVSMQTTTK